jgi:hypothetical protein
MEGHIERVLGRCIDTVYLHDELGFFQGFVLHSHQTFDCAWLAIQSCHVDDLK